MGNETWSSSQKYILGSAVRADAIDANAVLRVHWAGLQCAMLLADTILNLACVGWLIIISYLRTPY